MSSCLGIYTDDNLIKYAKVTYDKTGNQYTIDSYGVKFYDNMPATIEEISNETDIGNGPISLTLSAETYFSTQVFNNLKRKDMVDLIVTEYNERFGKEDIPTSVLDMRFKFARNIGVMDKDLAICVSTSKGELAKMHQTFEGYKIASIEPLSVSIKNLFENEGIDEEAAVINIEDKTTVTIFHRSEIQHIEIIPIGAKEILAGLTEKYNSISKAYDACKKVSAYLDDSYDVDEEAREILDVVIPVIYDIRQRTEAILASHKDAKTIYITGTGAIINNIDLYFKQTFVDLDCQVLLPSIIRKDIPNTKELIEVNSAIALALDGIGMADDDLDFNRAAKKAAGLNSIKEFARRYKIDEKKKVLLDKKNEIVDKIKDVTKKLNAPPKKKRKKPKIDIADAGSVTGSSKKEKKQKIPTEIGALDIWLTRATVFAVSAFVIYSFSAIYTSKAIAKKNSEINAEITRTNAVIESANSDASYLKELAADYVSIKDKLSMLIEKINEETKKNFDIPNFLSKLMFIMPSNVRVTSIEISDTGNVMIRAESGQYAELGYFVSRTKLENLLLDVDMEVQSVESNIKIIVSGVLP